MRWLTPRLCYATIFFGAVLLLCIALYMEHAMGLEPCALCMMQRIWVAAGGLTALVGLLHGPTGWGVHVYTGFGAASVVTGGGFSIRQIYLQSLPPDQVPACGPSLEYMMEVFPLSDVIEVMITGTGDCAEVVWTFLGLSIPGWSLIGFIVALTLFALPSVLATRNR
jgi:disulfide bond formation protein DsbB